MQQQKHSRLTAAACRPNKNPLIKFHCLEGKNIKRPFKTRTLIPCNHEETAQRNETRKANSQKQQIGFAFIKVPRTVYSFLHDRLNMKHDPFYWWHEHSFAASLSTAPPCSRGVTGRRTESMHVRMDFFFSLRSLRRRGEKTNSHYRLTAKRDINGAASATSRLHGTRAADAINSMYRARVPPLIGKLWRPLSGESSRVQGRDRRVGSPGGAAGACRCLMLFCCHFLSGRVTRRRRRRQSFYQLMQQTACGAEL